MQAKVFLGTFSRLQTSGFNQSLLRRGPNLVSLRFGSVFRNAIPPKRDYSPPSYEDIFGKTIRQDSPQSESTTRRSHAIQQFDPFPKFANSQAFPEKDRNSESTTANYFRSQLNAIQERNQEMLFGAEEPQISTTQRTSPRTTDMSLKKRREEQYLKAQKKLLQLQRYHNCCTLFRFILYLPYFREQATRIKAQQSQSKLMQMVLAKQKELEEKRRKKKEEEKQREEEEERRRLLDEESKRRLGSIRNNKESQYQTQFANNDPNEKTTMAEERRKHAEEKRKAYEEEKLRLQREEEERRRQKEKEAMLLKKAALEEKKRLLLEEMAQRKAKEAALRKEAAYKEKLDRWKSKYQKVSLPTGQKFLDKSTETKILDLNTKSENAEKSQSNDKIVEITTTTTSSPEKIAENELENRVGSSVGGSSSLSEVKQNKKIGNPFTQEVCETLRVPCR